MASDDLERDNERDRGGDGEKDKPLREDIRQLGRVLGDVVRAQAGLEVYEIVEGVRRHAVEMRRAEGSDGVDHDALAARLERLPLPEALHVIRAFSWFSFLVNIADSSGRLRRC